MGLYKLLHFLIFSTSEMTAFSIMEGEVMVREDKLRRRIGTIENDIEFILNYIFFFFLKGGGAN